MDQVADNLWLGDIASISDVENLKKNNIQSILSAVRGKVVVQGVSVSCKGAEAPNPHLPDRPSPTNKSKSTISMGRTS
jgi:hypothetical protein